MKAALKEAKKAFDMGEVPVGAVIVKDDRIIASAHNLCEERENPLYHAEIIALNDACKKLGEKRLEGCDLYVTLEPCAMCCGAVSHARISRLFFGAYDKNAGCVTSNKRLFDKESPLYHIEYYCGIMEDECSKLLIDFFKELRQDNL